MKNRSTLRVVGLALIASSAASNAFAEDTGYYLGGGTGAAAIRLSGQSFNPGASADEYGVGAKLYVGYRFLRNLALEAGYVDFDQYTASGTIGSPPVSAAVDINVHGFYLAPVGIWPVTQSLSVFGKIGAARWDIERDAFGRLAETARGDVGIKAVFGAGIAWQAFRHLGFRLEWERFNDIGRDDRTGSGHADLIGGGFFWDFR